MYHHHLDCPAIGILSLLQVNQNDDDDPWMGYSIL